MSNEDYTKQLAQDMADALNAASKGRSLAKPAKAETDD
jgi:hypothetical protein